MMQLDEFIRETLLQVVRGVVTTHAELSKLGASVSREMARPQSTRVDFDVAVTTTEESRAQGRAGLVVAGVGLGAKGEIGSGSTSISRVKLSVELHLPATGKGAPDPARYCKEVDEGAT